MKTVSILIPIYNEEKTILIILKKINEEIKKIPYCEFEIIVINDGSTDNSDNFLRQNPKLYNHYIHNINNSGKGFAIKAGLKKSKNEIILIQDADLEYLPNNYEQLLVPFFAVDADVVYGSRFRTTQYNRVMFFWHYIANNIITMTSNIFSNLNFSDVEVGFKLFKKKLLNEINLQEKSFGFEIELTHKLAKIKPQVKFFEVGISYNARTYSEGKKIGFKDALRAVYCIFKYSF